MATNLPVPAQPTVSTPQDNANIVAARIVQILIRAANSNNAAAQQLLDRARTDPKAIQPWQVRTIQDIHRAFGADANTILSTLHNQNLINDQDYGQFRSTLSKEEQYRQYAASLAALPEYPLKYRNMVPVYNSEGEVTGYDSLSTQQFQKYLNELNKLTSQEQVARRRVISRLNSIPLNRKEQATLFRLQDEEARALSLPPAQRQLRMSQIESEYESFERQLIQQQNRYHAQEHELAEIRKSAAKQEARERNRNSAALREKERIISRLNMILAGGQPEQPGPKLEATTNAVSLTSGGYTRVGQEKIVLENSSLFDNQGNLNKEAFKGGKRAPVRGAELALQYADLVDDIRVHVADSIKHECSRFSGVDPDIVEKIAESIGQEVAPDIAEILQKSLHTLRGVPGANNIARIFLERHEKDPAFRTRVATRIVETLDKNDPDFAVGTTQSYQMGRVEDFIKASMQGIQTHVSTPVEETEIRRGFLPNKNNAVHISKTIELPDGNHLVRGKQESVVATSLLNAERALSDPYMFRKWLKDKVEKFDDFIYGEKDLYTKERDTRRRTVQLAKQAAFVQGALDFEAELKKNPTNLLLSSISPLGFATGTAPYIAWHLAPEGLRQASIGVKGGLVAATGLIPGVGLLGPIAGSLVGLHLAKREFDVKYGFPILNTTDWLKAYTEGQVKQFAATYLPLAKYDNKGRLGLGLHLIPASWDIVCNFMGQTVKGFYDKRLLSLTGEKARNYSKSLGGRFTKSISRRWKDPEKRRDPLSILIFGPLNVLLKTATIRFLEFTGLAPALKNALESDYLGQITEAWRTGGGWADMGQILRMKDMELINLLEEIRPYENWNWRANIRSPEGLKYLKGIQDVNAKYGRLHRFGKVIRSASYIWKGGKVLFEAAFRGIGLGAISFLITGNPTTAVLVGAGYSVPWMIREFIQNPMFGGYYKWVKDGTQYAGRYNPGMFQRWNWSKDWLGKFSRAYNTPIGNLKNLQGVSRLTKTISAFGRLVPWDGMFMSVVLVQIGVPGLWPLVPTGVDLVGRILTELSKSKSLQIFFGPTGLWTKFTSIMSVGFNIGALTYALDTGIFEIFTRGFSVPRLMKLLTIPSTYLSFVGFFSAFPALAFGSTAVVAAGIATATVIVADTVLRWIGNAFNIAWAQHGIWGLLKKWIVDPFWDFLKSKGFDFAAGALAAIVGLFGAISSLMKGDIQNFSISMVLLIAGGLILIPTLVATTVPSSFYTPVIGAPANDYIESAYKEMTDYKVETLSSGDRYQLYYEYGYKLRDFSINDISSISIIETDTFTGLSADEIVSLSSDQGIERQDGKNIFEKSETFNSAKTVNRKFVLELSDSLENLLPDSDDYLCNTIQIKIAEIRGKEGALKTFNQPYVSRKICIDREGNPVGGILHVLPIDPNKGSITSCFECREVKKGDVDLDWHFHNGIDIGAAQGTLIYASGNGTIEKAGLNIPYYEGLGIVIVIDHGDSKKTVYGHLSKLNVKEGDIVKAGDIIGEVGNTGVSTGDHLHFSIYDGEGALNPCSEKELRLCSSYTGDKCKSTPLRPTSCD